MRTIKTSSDTETFLNSDKVININPLTTLATNIIKKKRLQENAGSIDDIITSARQRVTQAFNINNNDIELDYIENNNIDSLKTNTKINNYVENLHTTT